MTFSEKLIRLRKRESLSQEALAEILGVSRPLGAGNGPAGRGKTAALCPAVRCQRRLAVG